MTCQNWHIFWGHPLFLSLYFFLLNLGSESMQEFEFSSCVGPCQENVNCCAARAYSLPIFAACTVLARTMQKLFDVCLHTYALFESVCLQQRTVEVCLALTASIAGNAVFKPANYKHQVWC